MFIIGTIFGSFYLVLATRLPLGKDIFLSRSKCDKCNHELKWYNLIPIFSFIFQKGRCSYCHEKISPLNIVVEFITGLLFAICYCYFGINYNFFMGIIIISLTIIIFISDIKYMIILDSPLIVSGILIIILKLFYFGINKTIHSIISGIILFIIMLLVQKLGTLIFKKDALGGGDIKLSFIIGLILDIKLGLCAIILSSFLALPYAVASMYLEKSHQVSYGPFLSGALLIVFFFMDKFNILVNFLLPI